MIRSLSSWNQCNLNWKARLISTSSDLSTSLGQYQTSVCSKLRSGAKGLAKASGPAWLHGNDWESSSSFLCGVAV